MKDYILAVYDFVKAYDGPLLLVFIAGYQAARRGMSPSIREMGAALGLPGKSNVHALLVQLEERQRIRRIRYRARAIEVIDGPRQVPLIDMTDRHQFEHRVWDDGDKRLVPLAPPRNLK